MISARAQISHHGQFDDRLSPIAARAFFAAFARCRLSNTAANGTLVVLPTWFSPVARWWNDPLVASLLFVALPSARASISFSIAAAGAAALCRFSWFVCTDDPPGSPVLLPPLCRLHWTPNFHPRLTELTTRS